MGRLRDGHGGPSARPRYKRLGAAAGALAVTLVAVLGGMGVLPSEQGTAVAAAGLPGRQQVQPDGKPAAATRDEAVPGAGARGEQATAKVPVPTLPVNSGSGRRIVFAMGEQRVWLVGGSDDVRRTYLVSGSVTDNLHPGSYSVYSKSLHAIGVDDSGTMRYMVRFTQGDNAAIGFHDIPVLDHALVQGRDDLGTPQSHGCIRQWRPDAKALWDFAPVGTPVVVVA
ncbi:L,D-transpeptidase [Nocardioides panacis]|uniref:L,D-transpeptidase n=1 Tax=Nocardioides panacis TaxID=2849501 RepID=A0A975Y0K7_9ACTN|nr:L,D-transpeptidase [Nocardioides panacis]QWZ08571.1 L,D-transpeptidase [Nocardioides panacis]